MDICPVDRRLHGLDENAQKGTPAETFSPWQCGPCERYEEPKDR